MVCKRSDLASPFGVRLSVKHDKAIAMLANQQQASKNRLIQEAVKLLLENEETSEAA